MARRCPLEPHVHLPNGRIVLVPPELAAANQLAFVTGRKVGFAVGVLVGTLMASVVLLLGLLLGS